MTSSGSGHARAKHGEEGCFRGASVQRALQALRSAWGDDALVLDVTRNGDQYVVHAERSQPGSLHDPSPSGRAHATWMLREAGFPGSFVSDVMRRWTSRSPSPFEVTRILEQMIPIYPRRGCVEAGTARGRRFLLFMGPTGVGKTTTLAKLAGRLVQEAQVRPGLITLDTYRVAAVDQLRAYADMMRLPMAVASDRAEFRTALDRQKRCPVVLIDTAGRGQNDLERLGHLDELLSEHDQLEVFLCLSSTTAPSVLDDIMERFGSLKPDACVLTKLDENRAFGHLLAAAIEARMPVAYVTAGQEVPRDLEAANARGLIAQVLPKVASDSTMEVVA